MRSHHTYHESSASLSLWDGDIQQLKCIGNGVSSLVFAIDSLNVVKVPLGSSESKRDLETERRIYQKFGVKKKLKDHNGEHVLRCYNDWNTEGLVFERCEENVRDRLRRDEDVGILEKVKWMKQASKGLAFVHSCRVVQGDVGCHNMLLDSKGNLKLADFAGSKVDSADASIIYEVRSRLPGLEQPTNRSDIFALGSAFYEMATKSRPYAKVGSHRDIQTLYRQKKFPDVSELPEIGPIILKCWKQEFGSASDIVRALERVEINLEPDPPAIKESAASLDSGFSKSSEDHSRSDTYVGRHPQRRRSRKREGQVSGKREKRETRLHLYFSRFIFPWIQTSQKVNYQKRPAMLSK